MARIMVCADCGREDRICGSFHPCESTRCLDCRPKALWRILGRNMGLGIKARMEWLGAILTAPFHAVVFLGFAVAFGCCVVAAYGSLAVAKLTRSR